MENYVVWFDIPVTDLNRAINFYSKITGLKLEKYEMDSHKMAVFPHEKGMVGGCLVESADYKPSKNGPLLYFNGGEDLSVPLKKVKAAGGKILKDKMSIGENGFMAIIEDTEGNRIALHSMK